MEIGNDDFDELDEFDVESNALTQDTTDTEQIDNPSSNDGESSWISDFLKDKGIDDISKIKFENEDGDLEEVNWDTLDNSNKLEILRSLDESSSTTYNSNLNDSELELINIIRSSKMSPEEYVQYLQQSSVDLFIQNSSQQSYQIDDIDDDTLFVTDLLARVGEDNITDEEVQALLDSAKSNEQLFQKQINAIRNEYKLIEDNNHQQELEVQRQQQIESYNSFAESVENEIRNFKDFGGYDLNMDESEMEELYNFITGFDQAGVSTFSKVLNDPKLLVKMGWFILHGDEAMQDINNYWVNEIKRSRSNPVRDKKNNVLIVKQSHSSNESDDLDDF